MEICVTNVLLVLIFLTMNFLYFQFLDYIQFFQFESFYTWQLDLSKKHNQGYSLQLLDKQEIVGEIRDGLGLNYQVELSKDKKTKESFSSEETAKICSLIKKKAIDAGFFGMFVNPIPVVPPLTIVKNEIDEIVSKFDKIIA